MGLYLIASSWLDLSFWIGILKVAFGLGMVIFVHELGHFVVAKLCGVKCEKFYLGFDIAGLKFCKFTYGETEYGIGILPLGGYVKMLGQEDNPARLREEIEKAKQSGDQPEESEKGEPKVDLKAAEQALYDPRSYLAQSVPRRMAIISAGVIMNLIFAVMMAVVAFMPGMGVTRRPCQVGRLLPGEAAWQENLQVGDTILEVAGRKILKFRDMQEAISLGDDLEQGVPMVVRRPGVDEPFDVTVLPDSSGLLPRIGIFSSSTTTLRDKHPAVIPGSVADRAQPPLEPGDTIVEINGTPVASFAELHAQLALHRDQPLQLTVQRIEGKTAESASASEVQIEVPAKRMRRLGLVMGMGPIRAVQKESPATSAGIEPGDQITAIDGNPVGDPMTLADRLRRRAGETVTLTVERESEPNPLKLEAVLREVDWFETLSSDMYGTDVPMTVPALGIAFPVLNRVEAVLEGSPAAKAGLLPGDEIVEAILTPPEKTDPQEDDLDLDETSIEFTAEERNWPVLIFSLQYYPPGTQIQLNWVRKEKSQTATLDSMVADDWFDPDRGFILQPLDYRQKAASFGEAVRLGAEETLSATLVVYRFLRKIGTQISPKALGGPITIFRVAKIHADQGTSELLIFLTLLSANLAVINFLPIPLLDGGHMVLLTWEGIRGKPADERLQMVLTYIGLVFILSLMIWVIGLDIVRWLS